MTWARTGIRTPRYFSPQQRNGDVEAGARQPGRALREWLGRSAEQLSDIRNLSRAQWRQEVETAQGRTLPASEIP